MTKPTRRARSWISMLSDAQGRTLRPSAPQAQPEGFRRADASRPQPNSFWAAGAGALRNCGETTRLPHLESQDPLDEKCLHTKMPEVSLCFSRRCLSTVQVSWTACLCLACRTLFTQMAYRGELTEVNGSHGGPPAGVRSPRSRVWYFPRCERGRTAVMHRSYPHRRPIP